jgi:hypothetical protein
MAKNGAVVFTANCRSKSASVVEPIGVRTKVSAE